MKDRFPISKPLDIAATERNGAKMIGAVFRLKSNQLRIS